MQANAIYAREAGGTNSSAIPAVVVVGLRVCAIRSKATGVSGRAAIAVATEFPNTSSAIMSASPAIVTVYVKRSAFAIAALNVGDRIEVTYMSASPAIGFIRQHILTCTSTIAT